MDIGTLDDARGARQQRGCQNCTASTLQEMGVRRRYYSDNGEDALVMWTTRWIPIPSRRHSSQ